MAVTDRLASARTALASLQDAIPRVHDDLARDGLIQRFEFSFEAVWKAARALLLERHGIDAVGPKDVIRRSGEVGALSETDVAAALVMTDDRNRTSHTYDEAFAQALADHIPGHAEVLARWLDALG